MVNKVFEMREHGSTLREIREALHTSESVIDRILHDTNNVRRRLAQYNEQLRSATPIALRVVRETLESTAPQLAGERARMAQWVLESTKTVGKESPVNIFIKEGDTNITMSNDTLEAAKAVAAAMRATVEVKALPENVIEAEVINETGEDGVQHLQSDNSEHERAVEDSRPSETQRSGDILSNGETNEHTGVNVGVPQSGVCDGDDPGTKGE